METTPEKKKRRFGAFAFTRRSAAIVVALLMVAAPAGASVIVQNFMEADIDAVAPCFTKTRGDDAPADNSGLATFDDTSNTITRDGVNLLEEKITLTGMIGDRVIYTDVVNYVNNCGQDIDITLTTTGQSGTWTNVSAEIWLSNVETPANIDPNLDAAGPGSDWNDTGILLDGSGFVAASTGTVTVADGDSIQGAFVVSSDVAFVSGTTATANWVAQADLG